MKRYQIYLEDDQHVALARRAELEGTTVSNVIRRAVDSELSRPDETERLAAWRAAVEATAGIAPYLPEGRQYLDEIRAGERQKAAGR